MADEPAVVDPQQTDRSKKPKPTKALPTDRIAYAKQMDILRAFAIAAESNGGKPVLNNEVAAIVKMSPNTLPHANGFFAEIGLLQRPDGNTAGYLPTAEVVNFHRAFQWNPETAAHKLAAVFQATWFGQILLPRLSFRQMDEADAISILAEAAGATPEYKSQLTVVLSYLEAVGLISRDGGLVKTTKTSASANGAPAGAMAPPAMYGGGPPLTGDGGGVATMFNRPTSRGVQFQVNVEVDMKEMATWSPERIAAFFSGIAQVLSAKGAVERLD